jgi:signal peptide peptidase SppA
MADPEVHSVLLYIDSPGGAVDGTQELAREVYGARGKGKNIVAYSDGLMASSAYWIGAQAERVYISGDTVTVGSIGVVARHIDVSQMEQRMGVKTTEITAGRYKRAASEYEPLSETGRQTIQEMLDHIYGVFLSEVAKARPRLSLEPVKTGKEETIPWADGRLFLGGQAIDAGLVDGVATMASLISTLSEDRSQYASRALLRDDMNRRKIHGN